MCSITLFISNHKINQNKIPAVHAQNDTDKVVKYSD